MRFATKQLSVVLYQSRTQFLSGTGLKKLENSNTISIYQDIEKIKVSF